MPPSVDIPPTSQRNAQLNISYKQTLLNHLNPSNSASAPAQDNGSPSKEVAGDREMRGNYEVQDTWANQVEWEENYNNDAESGLDAVYDNNDLGFGPIQFAASGSGFDEQTVLNKLRALALEREELIGCASESLENELALNAEPKVLQVLVERSGISHLHLAQFNGNHEVCIICFFSIHSKFLMETYAILFFIHIHIL